MGVLRKVDREVAAEGPLMWRSVPLRSLSLDLRRAWERLANARGVPVLASPAWWVAFGAAFAEPGRPIQLEVLTVGEELRAVLPLLPRGRGRALALPENAHCPYGCVATSGDDPELAEVIVSHLLDVSDEVVLSGLHAESGFVRSMRGALEARGVPHEVRPHEKGDTRIVLSGSFEDLSQRMHRNIQRDLKQGMRRLKGLGNLRLDVATGPEVPGGLLDACFELESRGWKGVTGAPIVADPRTREFYRGLAQEAAAAGTFALYTLWLDDALVAFEYCLRGGGRIELLKISYDPAWARYSPGTVLRAMVLRHELERREMQSYHLGRPSDWKLRWTSDVQPLVSLRFYSRRMPGLVAWFSESVVGGGLRRVKGIRRAARWARRAAPHGGEDR